MSNTENIKVVLADHPEGLSEPALQRATHIYAYPEFKKAVDEAVESGDVLIIMRSVGDGGNRSFILTENATAIHRTSKSAGADVFAAEDVTIKKGETVLVPSTYIVPNWVRNMVFVGYLAMPRSSYWGKHKLLLTNGVGLIDMDFKKPVLFSYHNMGTKDVKISKGDTIGQLALMNLIQHGAVDPVEREGGFGWTDKKEEEEVEKEEVKKDSTLPPPPPPVNK